MIGVDGVLTRSSELYFLGHGFDEGDKDIQLGIHAAKEYSTM